MLPLGAKVKNVWSYGSITSCVILVWCFIKQERCLHGMAIN